MGTAEARPDRQRAQASRLRVPPRDNITYEMSEESIFVPLLVLGYSLELRSTRQIETEVPLEFPFIHDLTRRKDILPRL